ncbi:antibiotic biosynthesis monooxygenase [Solwaraspora sp. WMMD406]|uniref:antibiotic biosynthesis monooxygenase family protein n=1 Tax=Solwaraspora sp. WMMD406 TaxID=3016095 RepID=UPI0024170697|nr:antibiotic biosynthesis monooxygenase family protein [Solwaraspora sp. WMMD406]MDG4764871.1 antibiotic biosynthesis monooxygenase [Solwaraspora sp. WMMD406]
MRVINRFAVPSADATDFRERAHAALGALASCPGYLRGELIRALDDEHEWCLVTEWESVGTYRRALGSFDVKINATPLLAQSRDEPSAFETLAVVGSGGELESRPSDRATDPGR